MIKKKKAISPVVATALLLVVSVISVIGFQNWFLEFSTETLTDVDFQTSSNKQISIEGVIQDRLYIKSETNDQINLFQIQDEAGNTICEIQDNLENNITADTRLLLNFDNETVNTTHIKDLSGYNNHMLINSSIFSQINCLDKDCFEFTGNGSHLLSEKDETVIFDNNTDFTISTWFQTSDTIKTRQHILRKDGGDANRSSVSININKNYSHIEFCPEQCSSNYIEIIANQSTDLILTDGILHNIIVVRKKGNAKVYIDGTLTNNITNQSIIGGDFSSKMKLAIGISPRGFNSGKSFNGTIDEVSIYSKAISKKEVTSLYQSRKSKFYEQLLPVGIKSIDISSCNLNKNEAYSVFITTNSKVIQKSFTSK